MDSMELLQFLSSAIICREVLIPIAGEDLGSLRLTYQFIICIVCTQTDHFPMSRAEVIIPFGNEVLLLICY